MLNRSPDDSATEVEESNADSDEHVDKKLDAESSASELDDDDIVYHGISPTEDLANGAIVEAGCTSETSTTVREQGNVSRAATGNVEHVRETNEPELHAILDVMKSPLDLSQSKWAHEYMEKNGVFCSRRQRDVPRIDTHVHLEY